MNKVRQCVLCALALAAAVSASPCRADAVNGVLAEERIVNLPQDSEKWYISVVGDESDARYEEVLGWFDANPKLAKLKNQVMFCPVTLDMPLYAERYKSNIKGLPTVRMQQADGTVVYEAAGKNLPVTAGALQQRVGGGGERFARAASAAPCATPTNTRTIKTSRSPSQPPTPSRSRLTTAGRRSCSRTSRHWPC